MIKGGQIRLPELVRQAQRGRELSSKYYGDVQNVWGCEQPSSSSSDTDTRESQIDVTCLNHEWCEWELPYEEGKNDHRDAGFSCLEWKRPRDKISGLRLSSYSYLRVQRLHCSGSTNGGRSK